MIKTQPPTKNLAKNYGYRGIMFTRNMIYDSPHVKVISVSTCPIFKPVARKEIIKG